MKEQIEGTIEHTPVRMQKVDRWVRKSKPTARFKGGFNVWRALYRCPKCGAEKKMLENYMATRMFVCDGTQQRLRWRGEEIILER